MSLINDALKRASQAEKNRSRDSGFTPLMQPARETRRSNLPLIIVVGVVVVALLVVAGLLLMRALSSRNMPAPLPVPVAANPIAPAPPPKVEPAPAPVPVPPSAPVVANVPPPNPNPPPPPPVVPVVAPPPPFPDLKLQGIFYSRTNPKIILNGQTCGEGDQVGEVSIVKITPSKVTVQWNGQTKDLRIEGQ